MEEELKAFFASTEFLQKFKEHVRKQRPDWDIIAFDYELKSGCKEIRLHLTKFKGMKGLSIYLNNRTYVELIYWRNIDELSFILNRLPQIRWSNPLCSDSELQSV